MLLWVSQATAAPILRNYQSSEPQLQQQNHYEDVNYPISASDSNTTPSVNTQDVESVNVIPKVLRPRARLPIERFEKYLKSGMETVQRRERTGLRARQKKDVTYLKKVLEQSDNGKESDQAKEEAKQAVREKYRLQRKEYVRMEDEQEEEREVVGEFLSQVKEAYNSEKDEQFQLKEADQSLGQIRETYKESFTESPAGGTFEDPNEQIKVTEESKVETPPPHYDPMEDMTSHKPVIPEDPCEDHPPQLQDHQIEELVQGLFNSKEFWQTTQ